MKMILRTSACFLALMTFASVSQGAPFTQSFLNDYKTDAVYLFITAGDVNFNDLLSSPRRWTDTVADKRIVTSGRTIRPRRGNFNVEFSSNSTAFTMEWAELLGGSIQGSGSIFYNDTGNIIGTSNAFTSSVPIPDTYWLLGSGLIFFVGIRRKFGAERITNYSERKEVYNQA